MLDNSRSRTCSGGGGDGGGGDDGSCGSRDSEHFQSEL